MTKLREIRLSGGRILRATPVFDTYWRFASERQELFFRRVRAEPPPWTGNAVLAGHRFTNVYRASDRVTQYLIRHVIYDGVQDPEEVFFRTILFKIFNRIDTWEHLAREVGPILWRTFNFERYAGVLDPLIEGGQRLYSAAYIMPSPTFGETRKHRNHLRLLEHMMKDGATQSVCNAPSLGSVFHVLREYPSLGDFLAFQFAIDLNYSEVIGFSEMDFVVAGPGARDGIRKCFADSTGLSEADLIRAVADMADSEFARLGLKFEKLWGRRLQLIDCQNLFCEVGKYARVVHPDATGESGRTRIKQKFVPKSKTLPQWYPPKWKLDLPAEFSTETKVLPARARARGQTKFAFGATVL